MPSSASPTIARSVRAAETLATILIAGFGVAPITAMAQSRIATPIVSQPAQPSPTAKTIDPILSKECMVHPDGSFEADRMQVSETRDGQTMVICSNGAKVTDKS